MGNRVGAVPLSQISYHPSGGKCTGTGTETGPEFICDDYATCYQTIFHSRGDEALALPHFATKIVEICRELNMSSRMFMLANMYGFSRSSPDRHFNAKLLLMPRAKQRATLYRQEVTKCYGTFDVSALKQYADDDCIKLDTSFLDGVSDSEQLAARWIAGYKLARGGDPCPRFFRVNELRLSPLWLASEPHYCRYLSRHASSGTALAHLHENVAIAAKRYRDDPASLKRVQDQRFAALQLILPTVLGFLHLHDYDVRSQARINNSLDFWAGLGIAAQAKACLQFYNTRNPAFLTALQLHNVQQ